MFRSRCTVFVRRLFLCSVGAVSVGEGKGLLRLFLGQGGRDTFIKEGLPQHLGADRGGKAAAGGGLAVRFVQTHQT